MNSETQTYEAQILQQLIKNAERIAVTQKEVSDIKTEISDMKTKISDIKTELSDMKTNMQTKMSEMNKEISNIKTELSVVKAQAERSEWWLRLIAGAIVLSFFKDQLISFF